MSLVLKSNQSYTGEALFPMLDAYKARVLSDGGVIKDELSLLSAYIKLKEIGVSAANALNLVSPNWGFKESGGDLVKMYDLFDASADVIVESGKFPLSTRDGVACFYSAGSTANVFSEPMKKVNSRNLSLFIAHEKGAAVTGAAVALANISGINPTNDVISVRYSPTDGGYYDVYLHANKGLLQGIVPYNKNIGVSTDGGHSIVYIDGNEVKSIDSATSASDSHYLNLKALAQGYYYAVIAAHDLTEAQNKALSKFVANFV